LSQPSVRERALQFDCMGQQLVGVLSLPPAHTAELALLVVVGGPQVRSGSHRQFTQLCRAAAAAGVPAMRFDVRGMGDASGPLHTFEQVEPDIAAALDALQAQLPEVQQVVLWGLCDGASAALMYLQATRDPRIGGLVLLNPWVRSAQTLARTHVKHYYAQRLRQADFWRKLLTGGVALKAARDLLGNLRASSAAGKVATAETLTFQQRMLVGAEWFEGPVLWVLSGRDLTAREFVEHTGTEPRWQRLMSRQHHQRLDVPEADHTFSKGPQHQLLMQATLQWLQAGLTPGRSGA
jgi:exosortase A-associated hydrolase 1